MAGHNEAYHSFNEIRVDRLRDKSNNGAGFLNIDTQINVGNGKDFTFATTTGSKIGTGTNQKIGFYNATPVAQQTGVAVSAAAIHAALVNLGLITA